MGRVRGGDYPRAAGAKVAIDLRVSQIGRCIFRQEQLPILTVSALWNSRP
jgi:hypothetical protein